LGKKQIESGCPVTVSRPEQNNPPFYPITASALRIHRNTCGSNAEVLQNPSSPPDTGCMQEKKEANQASTCVLALCVQQTIVVLTACSLVFLRRLCTTN